MGVSLTRDQAIDYAPCRYNASRLWFRGPRKALRSDYIACLGGGAVYGRYVTAPWSETLEARSGQTVVNLGVENAGVDAYLNDAGALATAAQARVAVIHLTGAHNTSNRFYTVHPRRNDRFLKASSALRLLYPEMDFAEVHFTRHLLSRLHATCPDRFATVAKEACQAWQARMGHLIAQMNGSVFLLWFAPTKLSDAGADVAGCEPFLTRGCIASLTPHVRGVIEVVPEVWRAQPDEATIPALERQRADFLPGAQAHKEAAIAVDEAIRAGPK